jgi:uncharacterized protein (TIGR02266 family)
MANENEKTVSIRAKLKFADVASFIERYAPNVSTAGLFLKTPSPKPVGTRVKFELLISDGSAVMRGLGQVAWVRETEAEQRAQGMGIKFVKLDDASAVILKRIVDFKRSAGGAMPRSRYSEVPPPFAPVEVDVEEPAAVSAPAPAKKPRQRHNEVDLSAIDSMLADLAAPTPGAAHRRRLSKDVPQAASPIPETHAPAAPPPVVEAEPVAAPPPVVEAEPQRKIEKAPVSGDLADLLEPDMPDPEPVVGRTISFMPPRPNETLDDAFASVIDSVRGDDAPRFDLADSLEDDDITELGEDAVISSSLDSEDIEIDAALELVEVGPADGDTAEEEIAIDLLDGLLEEADAEELIGDLPRK